MEHKGYSRREFLRLMGVAASTAIAAGCGLPTHPGRSSSTGAPSPGSMPFRNLGSTGHSVSLMGLGGESSLQGTNSELAIQIINDAIDSGVNYLDTSPNYGSGNSETHIGQVMQSRRNEVFLATKTGSNFYDGVMSDVDGSLSNLKTDYLDLYQLHDVRDDFALGEIFSSRGALKAMERLRDEGVVRNIGITGHYDPSVLLEAINQYPFDTILFTLNAADCWHLPSQGQLLQAAVEKQIGIIAMKVTGKRGIIGDGRLSMEDAMRYVYSFPVSTAIVGISTLDELAEDLTITSQFQGPLSAAELEQIELSVEPYQADGNWFKRQ